MAKIKLIIFDAGDILFDSGMRHFNKMYYNFLKKHKKEHMFDKTGQLWTNISEKARTGKISQFEANRRIFSLVGIHPKYVKDVLALDRKLLFKIKLYRGVLNALKRLRMSGYKLAILTDVVWPKNLLKIFFGGLKLTTHIDYIFASNEIGYSKPHKRSYHAVMKYFHATPSETVFVGHSKDEILGARRLGIKTVKLWNEKAKSDFRINSLTKLPTVMKKIKRQLARK